MKLNIWLKTKTAIYIGGDPTKGLPPVVTTELEEPQLLVDTEAGTVTIIASPPKK